MLKEKVSDDIRFKFLDRFSYTLFWAAQFILKNYENKTIVAIQKQSIFNYKKTYRLSYFNHSFVSNKNASGVSK